jgi:hypothetical protein
MVFEIDRIGGRLGLVYVAFGLRHPRRETPQLSVYEVAHRCFPEPSLNPTSYTPDSRW